MKRRKISRSTNELYLAPAELLCLRKTLVGQAQNGCNGSPSEKPDV